MTRNVRVRFDKRRSRLRRSEFTAASRHQQIEKPRVCLVLVSLCQRTSFLSPPDQSHYDRTQAPYGS